MNPRSMDKLTGGLVPARLPKRDACVQPLTSPVWETQVVDRTGSGTYRRLQDVRVSSHMMNTMVQNNSIFCFQNHYPPATWMGKDLE